MNNLVLFCLLVLIIIVVSMGERLEHVEDHKKVLAACSVEVEE